MCSKKKDLEIICNLQWKNKPYNGVERSNIIGVYDVPSTTLNWEIFKSYLLKNSGTPGDDVRVSYLATNEKEFPIQNQLDFQIALYAFRKKARNGEIINLKLDRISGQDKTVKKITASNDVQTQFDNDGAAACTSSNTSLEIAPQWFTDYMTEFKKDILSEVSATVSSYVSTMKSHGVQPYHSRKSKTESSKRSRKHPLFLCEVGNEREFLKTLKLEKKVETKLEKLESKSKKLKEKKMSLLTKSSDSDAGHSSSKSNSDTFLNANLGQMNAAPVRYQQSVIPHMMGGEVYLHTWDVINNGTSPWTSDTELHFTWGSASLEPVERIVPCPPLKPGESGSINVLLNVPKKCGQYESYWYFHHKGRKFGHWLGCQIIVDKVNSEEPLTTGFLNTYEQLKSKYESVFPVSNAEIECKIPSREIPPVARPNISGGGESKNKSLTEENPAIVQTIESQVKDLQIEPSVSAPDVQDEFIFTTHAPIPFQTVSKEVRPVEPVENIEKICLNASPSKIQIFEKLTNDEDPSNIEETANDFKEPNQNKQIDLALESDDNNNNTEGAQDSCSESISKIDEDTTSNSTLNDMVMINFGDEMDYHDTGYAFVVVDGTKVPIPKKYLRSDFLETAEDAPDPKTFVKVKDNNDVHDRKTVEEASKIEDKDKPNVDQASTSKESTSHNFQKSQVNYSFLLDEARNLNESYTIPSAPEATGNSMSSMEASYWKEKVNSRMFVFPQDCPGYEIIPPSSEVTEAQIGTEANWSESKTGYSFCNDPGTNNQFMKCNVYQPDPEMNLQYQYHKYPYSQSVFTNAPSQQNPPRVDSSVAPNGFPNQSFPNNYPIYPTGSNGYPYVPNYQQTPPELRPKLKIDEPTSTEARESVCSSSYSSAHSNSIKEDTSNVQKEVPASTSPAPIASVVSGAMTMASTALNTAKNVVNMIIPDRNEKQGVWVNGHWVSANPETPREANLKALADMGFWDRDLNATLLARYNDDIAMVVAELIQ